MTVFRFEEADETLAWMPLAARRACDRAGRKLSLAGWQSLPMDRRRAVTTAGAHDVVDVEAVRAAIDGASPAAKVMDPRPDASAGAVPKAVQAAMPDLDVEAWQAVGALGRHVLAHLVKRGKAEGLAEAYEELSGG